MVGLSIVLESQDSSGRFNEKHSQNINKTTMNYMTTKPSQRTSFLEQCFLCAQKLLPGKDIYMYKGDRAFCSVECRCRQMHMDEEETTINKGNNCPLTTFKPPTFSSSASSSSGASRYR